MNQLKVKGLFEELVGLLETSGYGSYENYQKEYNMLVNHIYAELNNTTNDDEDDWGWTQDTHRRLVEGEGAFYIEGHFEWWDNWLRMIISLMKRGWSKQELRDALDLDYDGIIYWTEFYE